MFPCLVTADDRRESLNVPLAMFEAFVVSTSATFVKPTCAFVVACGLLVLDVCDVSVERFAVI